MDICLIAEGTYPYHVGGVSTWTHTLLQGLSDVHVSVVPLYAGEAPEAPVWSLPQNVSLHSPMKVPDSLAPAEIVSWAETAVSTLPAVDLTHTLTAGVAGQLGRALRDARDTPLLVTEHGIGWHELRHGAGETETGFHPGATAEDQERAVQHLRHHARTTYAAADCITAVAWSTQEKQQALGADPARRYHVIPNGVEVPADPPSPSSSDRFHIGLVGRVTPLKDIQTFLHACAQVQAHHPSAKFFVVGPPTDPAYTYRCHALSRSLGLTEALTFVEDARTMSPWYDQLDVVALTSRSEAQPLALLEAMAHARPVVATDVGDCRRLVTGPDDDFGVAGQICPPGDADAIARALTSLGRSPKLRRKQGIAGWRRVRAAHRQDQMIAAYQDLYAELGALTPSSL